MTTTRQNPAPEESANSAELLRVLFIGDVVGGPGRKIVAQALPPSFRDGASGWSSATPRTPPAVQASPCPALKSFPKPASTS